MKLELLFPTEALQQVLDRAASLEAKARGMERAEIGAGLEWADRAAALVLKVASSKASFTSDDLWAAGLEKPKNPRALGPVLVRLAKFGKIRKTGAFVGTSQKSRHNAPVAIWEACR